MNADQIAVATLLSIAFLLWIAAYVHRKMNDDDL